MNSHVDKFLNNIEKLCAKNIENVRKDAQEKLKSQKFSPDNNVQFGYRQLNEILLLCNEKIVSEEFFYFLANIDDFDKEKTTIAWEDFENKINEFRKLSMLQFGSFRFAFNYLCRGRNIKNEFERWVKNPGDLEKDFLSREKTILKIEEIEKDKLSHLGYLTGDKNQLAVKDTRQTGRKNFDTYLTYDYIDIYVATSMRDPWDFVDVNKFCNDVILERVNAKLKNVRYFDPTLNFHENSILKGLIEGLMLKRAKCTLYLAQESDTMGKDSEMASTLAQGKPVIVYLPEINIQEEINKLSIDTPLDLLGKAKRLSMFLERKKRLDLDKLSDKTFKIKLGYVNGLGIPIKKIEMGKNQDLIQAMAKFKAALYDKRAETLISKHPLRFQINLHTGVANGVLVARKRKDCAELIYQILTNQLKFKIYEPMVKAPREKENDEFNYRLIEQITGCAFRVVTKDEKLTNSFWNLYKSAKGFNF